MTNAQSSLPVADEWFHITKVDDSITLIQEPHVDPFLSANTWHIHGQLMDVLIDSGMGISPLRPELQRLFPDREPVVVLTHAHLDHMGSAHEFAECWAHPLEPTTQSGFGTLYGPELMHILGAPDVEDDPPPPLMLTALPHADYQVDDYELIPVLPTRRLEEGDKIDLGDRMLTVLHLPGHTPGSIALHDVANKVLFTGDVIYDPPFLLDNLHGSNISDYRDSIRRLLDLEVDIVHTGHGESFDRNRLRELASEYLTNTDPQISN